MMMKVAVPQRFKLRVVPECENLDFRERERGALYRRNGSPSAAS